MIRRRANEYTLLLFAFSLTWLLSDRLAADSSLVAAWIATIPSSGDRIAEWDLARMQRAARPLDQWASRLAWENAAATEEARLAQVRAMIAAKRRVDEQLQRLTGWRTEVGNGDREHVCRFLEGMSQLIETSGRFRYYLRDVLEQADDALAESPSGRERLLNLVFETKPQVAAEVFSYILADPDPDRGLRPFPAATKRRILRLMADSRSPLLLEDLAEFISSPAQPPELLLDALEVIRVIGLPQRPAPHARPDLAAAPVLSDQGLRPVIHGLNSRRLSASDRQRWEKLRQWIDVRSTQGVEGEIYRAGTVDLRPGDWLLMRNPSPYNRFTSHRPGLFTHVGIVTTERAGDGIRRFVVVDIPERGDRVPASNVEAFLGNTLHFAVLRHADPQVANKMSEVARSLIGNESQFDLQFQTSRVESLRGQPLAGAFIHTYCAGLLLLAAQETGIPAERFFPVRERCAEGRCAENLRLLGLAIGDEFVSPTGALFSSDLDWAGSCEPMYEPEREIRELIFDGFAQSMLERELVLSPTLTQFLREKVAGIAQQNPWLARMLARANKVNEKTDLESAARAAAVVETLDRIVEQASIDFRQARLAVTALPEERPRDPGELQRFQLLRQRHSDLLRRFDDGRLTPRVLRTELVEYYGRNGILQLRERFFANEESSSRP